MHKTCNTGESAQESIIKRVGGSEYNVSMLIEKLSVYIILVLGGKPRGPRHEKYP